MKLIKPIQELTIEQLQESQEYLRDLIKSTEFILYALQESEPLTKLLELHLQMATLPDLPEINFRELTHANLENFNQLYDHILEEIGRREDDDNR